MRFVIDRFEEEYDNNVRVDGGDVYITLSQVITCPLYSIWIGTPSIK
jgi:hypothetical protein